VNGVPKIEHWPQVGQIRIDLRDDLRADYGREVAPGVVFHFAGSPETEERNELVFIEVEARPGRDLSAVAFERFDDSGEISFSVPGEDATAMRRDAG